MSTFFFYFCIGIRDISRYCSISFDILEIFLVFVIFSFGSHAHTRVSFKNNNIIIILFYSGGRFKDVIGGDRSVRGKANDSTVPNELKRPYVSKIEFQMIRRTGWSIIELLAKLAKNYDL